MRGIRNVIRAFLTSVLDAGLWSVNTSGLCLEYGQRVLISLKGSVGFLVDLEAFLVSGLEPSFTGRTGGGLITVVTDLPRTWS